MQIAQATSRPTIGETVVVITEHDVPRHGIVSAHYQETKFVIRTKRTNDPHHDAEPAARMYDINYPLGWMTIH